MKYIDFSHRSVLPYKYLQSILIIVSQFLGRLISPGSLRRRKGSGALKEKRTNFFSICLSHITMYLAGRHVSPKQETF